MRTGIILLLVTAITVLSCDRGENEIFIIPDGYTGYVLVIYDQENGVKPKYDKETRIYEIPENGVLKTIFTTNSGWTDFPAFYYQEIKEDKQIPFKVDVKTIPTDTIVVYGGTSGSIKKRADSEERVRFIKFYIGTKSQIEAAVKEAERLDIISLADE